MSWTLTSHLVLQVKYDSHSLMEDEQFSHGLLVFQVQLAHATQLLEGLVDVSHPEALTGIVRRPPLALTLGLLLRVQVLVLGDTLGERTVLPLMSHSDKKQTDRHLYSELLIKDVNNKIVNRLLSLMVDNV